MKPNKDAIKTRGNMSGEDVRMSIDESAMAHIMGLLTDAYSDPEMAVVREYATNARDAQLELAAQGRPDLYSRPIEVTLPSQWKLEYSVRDYGIGLDADGIREIYSKYGASTKRDSNDYNGALGIGCKSALAYSSQFTVVSVKDGIKTTVLISRDDDGATQKIVSEVPTTDERGTQVIVPAKSNNGFAVKARDFFRFWNPEDVRIDGRKPESFTGLKLSDSQWVVESGVRDNMLVMGGVAYPIHADRLKTGLPYGSFLVAYIDNGTATFHSSREQLIYNSITKAAISKIEAEFKANIDVALQREIDKCPTPFAALRKRVDWEQRLPQTGTVYKFQGQDFPNGFRLPQQGVRKDMYGNDVPNFPQFTTVPDRNHKLSQFRAVDNLSLASMMASVYFHGYKRASFSANMRKKLDLYMSQKGLTSYPRPAVMQGINNYVLVETIPADVKPFIDAALIHDWADVEAIKLPTYNSNTGHVSGSFDMYIDGVSKSNVLADSIDPTKPCYHHYGNAWEAKESAKFLNDQSAKGCTVVCLPANRIAKYERENTRSVRTWDAIQKLAANFVTQTDEATKKALKMKYDYIKDDLATVPAGVIDPALKEAAKLARLNIEVAERRHRMYERVHGKVDLGVTVDNPLEQYPLYDARLAVEKPKHVVTYLNAAYSAEQAPKGK